MSLQGRIARTTDAQTRLANITSMQTWLSAVIAAGDGIAAIGGAVRRTGSGQAARGEHRRWPRDHGAWTTQWPQCCDARLCAECLVTHRGTHARLAGRRPMTRRKRALSSRRAGTSHPCSGRGVSRSWTRLHSLRESTERIFHLCESFDQSRQDKKQQWSCELFPPDVHELRRQPLEGDTERSRACHVGAGGGALVDFI